MKTETNTLFDSLKQLVREAVREELQALNGNKPNPPKLLLDTKEAAAMIAVPESWLAEAARENKIPSVRVGHYRRFRLIDLESFIKQSAVKVPG
jgi:excisionase family DNA binding protein